MSTAQEFESMKQAMRRQQLRVSQTHQVRMVNTIVSSTSLRNGSN
jgi:hypothetical protein